MAQQRWGDQILASIKGVRFGLDHRDLLVGHAGYRNPQEVVTAGSTLSAAGTSVLETTAAAVYELIPPSASMRGVKKRVVSNSTAAHSLSLTAGNFASNALSTYTALVLTGVGEAVDLEYISTSIVAVLGATANITSLATST